MSSIFDKYVIKGKIFVPFKASPNAKETIYVRLAEISRFVSSPREDGYWNIDIYMEDTEWKYSVMLNEDYTRLCEALLYYVDESEGN